MKFLGYIREDSSVGVRNHLAVIPSVFCANTVAKKIAANIPQAKCLPHSVGCSQVGEDLEITARTLKNIALNPNIGGVLIVGLGCERFSSEEFFESVRESGKPVEKVVIHEIGSSIDAISVGIEKLQKLYEKINCFTRKKVDISELTVGLECGGSDAASGISANPAIGKTSDMLVGCGGAVIFSETTELIGAEHILEKRCETDEVAEKMLALIRRTENELVSSTSSKKYKNRTDLISTGNFSGGVSTVVEKALGNIHKTGTSSIKGAVNFAEQIISQGLNYMDTPGQDGESTTGLVAGGAQIILFTTGRGTPTGFPTAPVVKISSNSALYKKMKENIDIDAGGIINGKESIETVGKTIFDFVVEVASGKQVKAEIMGHNELFNIPRVMKYCSNIAKNCK